MVLQTQNQCINHHAIEKQFTREANILSENILAIRNGIGLTRKQFAKYCGISTSTLERIERRKEAVSLFTLAHIANACHIDTAVLLSEQPIMRIIAQNTQNRNITT